MTALAKLIGEGDRLERHGPSEQYAGDDPPMRSELFSAEQMAQHGIKLAGLHKTGHQPNSNRLLERLAENEALLSDVYNLLADAVHAKRRITPAGDWLLDNFYLIEEQIRTAKRHLPKGYSRELPRLESGPSAGLPRVYDIALAAIAHGDGRVDAENLAGFVASYQTICELKLGELWAIPIVLRLALIENLRRVAVRIAAGMIERDLANSWADKMMEVATDDPKSLILVVADMARSNPPMVSSFVSELSRRLLGQSSALALALTWIEQRLSESNSTIEQMVQEETERQATDQVSISNSIGSLRVLGAMDWRKFVESQSAVERILMADTAFGGMDFSTRDYYRHKVEMLAKKSLLSEGQVATIAIELAKEGALAQGVDDRIAHVGFYLIDKGLSRLEDAARVKGSFVDYTSRIVSGMPLLFYLGPTLLLTAIFGADLIVRLPIMSANIWLSSFLVAIVLISTGQLGVAIVNWLATLLARSTPLPKMDFSKGIPVEAKTLVVVPTMITTLENVEHLIEALEVRFLANREQHIFFGLLTDFGDAASETVETDQALLQSARQHIEELNKKYRTSANDIFFLFHRPRLWNSHQRTWMAYERKRGKLAALNSLLRGGNRDSFSAIVGDTTSLSNIKYVITLDTDTQLPRDAARQLVGAMMHPLNRAHFDPDKKVVTKGFGILQPRVGVSLTGATRSIYAALHSHDAGIDPYTRTVSDVYQDVFYEGSFTGKGIYDVDAFESALKDRLPENRILSHDLLEGCYARSGLLSDVQLFEEYPSSYSADVKRRHRWIRGDWQIIGWLFARVPVSATQTQQNPLSALSRWKILDNLRRSLVSPSLMLLFIFGWTILSPVLFWTMAALSIILFPPALFVILQLLRKPVDMTFKQHLVTTVDGAARQLNQTLFFLACLPYEACFSLDAIVRTLFSLTVSRRNLLSWNPSTDARITNTSSLSGQYVEMLSAPIIAVMTAIVLIAFRRDALFIASPILLSWLASPALAWWMSRTTPLYTVPLSASQKLFLRKIARKTWFFFETFVSEEDHWLPPDNVQESPVERVAHRTSPTNIGLSLLANLSAHDFGYIQAGQLIARSKRTFRTMRSLDRHRGHLYNWYDTKTLRPLPPHYISTVDSGNLAGHLLTFKAGLNDLIDQKILDNRIFDGIADAFFVLSDVIGKNAPQELKEFENSLKSIKSNTLNSVAAIHHALEQLSPPAGRLTKSLESSGNESLDWAKSLECQIVEALDELVLLSPWITLPDLPTRIAGPSMESEIPTLREVAGICDNWLPAIKTHCLKVESTQERKSLDSILILMSEASRRARARIAEVEDLINECSDFAEMEYEFLFDKSTNLLSIGFNADERRLDASYYDLLASEARLCNFVGIAQDKLPQESWFALGRLLTTAGGKQVLFSWSGSMFEYLMPLLVMPTYTNTLLDQTYKASVDRQIEYGKLRGVPWGVSESGYYAVDVQLNYQYHAFGVPGLGLKRGLAQDLVIAPYASALALMVSPQEACLNLQRLAEEGFDAKYGFFEAIDYTTNRIPRGQTHAVVQSFMAHHQGMSFLALAYVLLDQPMQRRFLADPALQATMLLLQERIPKASVFHSQTIESAEMRNTTGEDAPPVRCFTHPTGFAPAVQLLSNGKYHVMITDAGGGYSRWQELAVTRWREDTTLDNWGTLCYLRDVATGEFWSNTYNSTLKPPENYQAILSEARVEFRRCDYDFDTHTEIVVSSEDDVELRRIRITNRSKHRRTIELTTYAEVVLAPPVNDWLHPAFSNLFVETEILKDKQAILCKRRPRSNAERIPCMFHLIAIHGADQSDVSYETDRMQFIGRGNSLSRPSALTGGKSLSGSQGSVLDPIVAIRCRITLNPEESAKVNMFTGIAENREACLSLVDKYQDRHLADRVFDLAWTHSQVVLRQLNATESDGQLYAQLAASVLYANQSLRADASILVKNRRGQYGLWGYAISGDLPIVLLQIKELENIELVRQLVKAHAYWRLKGLAVDLVIWNEDRAGYRQLIHDQIMGLIASGAEANLLDKPGGIFVRAAEQISDEDRILLQTVARVIINDSLGSLAEQISRPIFRDVKVPKLSATRTPVSDLQSGRVEQRADLVLFNGTGGFTSDGREYVISTSPNHVTPAPWVNVLANPFFGTVISESGLAYTWLENAHEFRLTPWNNDPVTDAAGEAFYLRDEESGYVWSPCPLPVRGNASYRTRHGHGYSVFEHTASGIASELKIYVANDAPVKFATLRVQNHSGRARRLSATSYVEWVLGDVRSNTAMHIVTELEPKSGALLARNPYNSEFSERVAFLDVDDNSRSVTGDRREFIGRNASLEAPAAMSRVRLSGKVGAGLDPCGALQVPFELEDGEAREITFRLGIGQNIKDTTNLIERFRGKQAALDAFESLCHYWKHTLGCVNVDTPDQSLNMLTNGWLLYQTISCRLWGRSGYYQSGGAFGFRDQLQDCMALIHAEPQLLRKQLLICASRQFVEGDVQHWWHPPSGRGVRTRCSDDYLWLPLATCRFVMTTGDKGVLDEQVHFLTGRPVNLQDDSYYDLPGISEETATLYEHCKRAILNGLNQGNHGLPLIGTGDWNDGMNLVGIEGKGESVWLAFFLHEVLRRFTKVARLKGDESFAVTCEMECHKISLAIEKSGWDGEWYRRAYFDDGSPLGSVSNSECQIDSISQSWSVLSGAGNDERCRIAMNSLDARLVRRDSSLIQLLDPPFDKSALNPGYIKGYVPGVRENGGQYTHAAIWATMAFAVLGDNKRAWELFEMINPINHGNTPKAVETYKVEPYVVAADVYAAEPHTGRGGWTWYTGSASWMYRLITESLLGLRLQIDKLRFSPCLPESWNEYKVHYRYRETVYHITVSLNSTSSTEHSIIVDGVLLDGDAITLVDDRIEHSVEVKVPRKKVSSESG